MNIYFRTTVAALSLILLLSSVSVSAKTPRRGVYAIPFAFNVGGETLPAGKYRIRLQTTNSDRLWVIERTDGGARAVAQTAPVTSREGSRRRLIFHSYGDQYFLAEFYTEAGDAGREVTSSRAERAVAARAAERRTIALVIHQK